MFWPLLLSVQAGAYARSGRPTDGLGFIEEAIEIAGSGLTLVPEFYLLKGDLLLALPAGMLWAPWRFWRAPPRCE